LAEREQGKCCEEYYEWEGWKRKQFA